MTRHSRSFISIVMGVLLFVTACTSAPATTAPSSPTSAPASAPTKTPEPTATSTATVTPTVAPTDTPVPPAASGNACLIGAWEMTDMTEYFTSIMAKANTPFKLTGKEGSIRIIFGADGKAALAANQWKVTLSGTIQGLALTVVISIDGGATADYSATADTITFSNRKNDNMVMSATLNGQELFSGTSDELAALFGVSGSNNAFNTFAYECADDTLTYTPPVANAKAVVLTRVP